MARPTFSTPADYTEITYEVSDRIATLTMHRPDKLNAFTVQMMWEMIDAIDRVDADDDVRVLIVTGAGRGFCAGADLSAGGASFDYDSLRDPEEEPPTAQELAMRERDGGGLLTLRLYECRKPIIAAINGAAVGVGSTMTLPMDIRMASTAAKMGFVFTQRGIVLEACSSWFLPKVVGLSQALEWSYTGKVFPAAEAHAGGLVRSVHEPDELLPAARALAADIAENTSAVSVAATRALLWRMVGADHPMEAHKLDSRLVRELGAGADAREGVVSFLEKRPADFTQSVSTDLPPTIPWWEDRPFE
jgi:enoyl-CoA hydratase/carnithine racemase